jgi:AhpD family alkylhydroperoxidase
MATGAPSRCKDFGDLAFRWARPITGIVQLLIGAMQYRHCEPLSIRVELAYRCASVSGMSPYHAHIARIAMATVRLLTDDELAPEARSIFDDIRATYNTDYVNDFWRALANDPPTMGRTWLALKEAMGPGALEPKVKEMLYVAVSIAHGCEYCIHTHTAAARRKGMTDKEYGELLGIVGMAAQTNRLVQALGVPVDPVYRV